MSELMNEPDHDHDSLLSSFIAVTGQDPERSRLYLESTGWNLDLAIQTFYEGEDENAEAALVQPDPPISPIQPSGAAEQQPDLAALLSQPPVEMSSGGNSGGQGRKKEPRRGIATFGSLRQQEQESDSGSDDDNQQAFYAGGSERSGQQVLGPRGGKKRDPDEVVAEMFRKAKEHGGEVVDPSEARQKKPSAFGGAGYRLGTEAGESSSTVPSTSGADNQPIEFTLRLWRNGFTVDEGELRRFDDPTNEEFLKAIQEGSIPRELVALARGGRVSLNMEDHRHEEFVPVKKKVQAFAGEGHRLGSIAPGLEQSGQVDAAPGNEEAARNSLNVNENAPTTSVQIRLADSTRLVVKLNLTHTIAQIREYICTMRPGMAARTFALMTTFPNKELTDEAQTIEEASLQNAVIVQRFT